MFQERKNAQRRRPKNKLNYYWEWFERKLNYDKYYVVELLLNANVPDLNGNNRFSIIQHTEGGDDRKWENSTKFTNFYFPVQSPRQKSVNYFVNYTRTQQNLLWILRNLLNFIVPTSTIRCILKLFGCSRSLISYWTVNLLLPARRSFPATEFHHNVYYYLFDCYYIRKRDPYWSRVSDFAGF